jgi:hypothetical protein
MSTAIGKMIDRMVLAYERGQLVPFLGAGMSYPVCPLWMKFVSRLESEAKLSGGEALARSSGPPQRAAKAVRRLRLGGPDGLARGVRNALGRGSTEDLPQTRALAGTYWPLALTTNYDDLFIAATAKVRAEDPRFRRPRQSPDERKASPFVLLGRRAADCQRVLASLRQPDDPILWAIQGYVGGQAEDSPVDDPVLDEDGCELEGELVVGHLEYRKVARAAQHFRRAFAEVFRSRSLLFVGAGLSDQYFLELFNEIIELHGPSAQSHYAFMPEGSVDPDFLKQYYGIWVAELPDMGLLANHLESLRRRVDQKRPRQTVWVFNQEIGFLGERTRSGGELRIVRGKAPEKPAKSECVVFSAGGSRGTLKLSYVGVEILKARKLDHERSAFELVEGTKERIPIWRHETGRYFAVNARLDPWTTQGAREYPRDPTVLPIGPKERPRARARDRRDLRMLSTAIRDLLAMARDNGIDHVHSVLLASGPLRTFPRSAALQEMIRGWSRWRSDVIAPVPGFSIHVVALEVLYDLGTGRLEIDSCMNRGVTEFWLKIVTSRGNEERYFCAEPPDTSLVDLLSGFGVTDPRCRIELFPTPATGWGNWTLEGVGAWREEFGPEDLSIRGLGVRSGSTLRIRPP